MNILDAPKMWEDGSSRVWSLLEMVQLVASRYIYIGRVLQYWIQDTRESNLSKSDHEAYNKGLSELAEHCNSVGLSTSKILVMDALDEASADMSYSRSSQKMGELQRCIEAELRSKFF